MALRDSLTKAALGVALLAAQAMPSLAADFIAMQPADGSLCGEQRVLSRVSANFAHQVRHVPNLPQVDIVDYAGPRLTRYEPAVESSPIERTYCQATALLSDGSSRQVWYLVEGGQGFASIGDNVEFCVAGFDRWHVYDSQWCRVLR